jgi:hypothetical protein
MVPLLYRFVQIKASTLNWLKTTAILLGEGNLRFSIKYLARDDSGLNLSVIPLLGHHLFFYLELPLDAFKKFVWFEKTSN